MAEIIAQGHEIALHGVDHLPLDVMNPPEVFTRTVEAKEELEELIGQPVLWFRPPYGRKTPETMREVFRVGLFGNPRFNQTNAESTKLNAS